MAAFPWNPHAAEEERLGIDISVHVQGKDLSKMLNIYIVRRQFGLTEIRAGARVVVLGRNHPLCRRQRRDGEDDQKDDRTITNPFPSALTHSESLYEDALRSPTASTEKGQRDRYSLLLSLHFPLCSNNIRQKEVGDSLV